MISYFQRCLDDAFDPIVLLEAGEGSSGGLVRSRSSWTTVWWERQQGTQARSGDLSTLLLGDFDIASSIASLHRENFYLKGPSDGKRI